jgi:hypothetical protein
MEDPLSRFALGASRADPFLDHIRNRSGDSKAQQKPRLIWSRSWAGHSATGSYARTECSCPLFLAALARLVCHTCGCTRGGAGT